jgi:shikimate dehydrogenase
MTEQRPESGLRAAVLGHPIAHSLSPVLHRAAYEVLGLNWSYEAIDVDSAGLSGFLEGLDDTWVGLSLTMPLKEAVLPRLTSRSPLVDLSQAANTVLIDESGLHGHNTDVPGFVAAFAEHGIPQARTAVILGSGATARSGLLALGDLGVVQVVVVGRSRSDLDRLIALGDDLGLTVTSAAWSEVSDVLAADLVVSTVPAEVAGAALGDLPSTLGTLFDVIYDPWPTPLAQAWADRGPVIGGLDLLVHQARLQVELMTGRPAPLDAMRAAGERALLSRR